MTFLEVHLAVRDALRGSPFTAFLVTVQSLEQHPGRVDVEWRIAISDVSPVVLFKGHDPIVLLEMMRARLRELSRGLCATDPPSPPELAAVGRPPEDGALLGSSLVDEVTP